MKAYINKFRAPGIHKVPAPKPNESKQEESQMNKSQSTVQSPESSKHSKVNDNKNQKSQLIKKQDSKQQKQEKLEKKDDKKQQKVRTNQQTKQVKHTDDVKQKVNPIKTEEAKQIKQSEQGKQTKKEQAVQLSKQKPQMKKDYTINWSKTPEQSQKLPPSHSLFGSLSKPSTKEQAIQLQKPQNLPPSHSLFGNLTKPKQNSEPFTPSRSLSENHLKQQSKPPVDSGNQSSTNSGNHQSTNSQPVTKNESLQQKPAENSIFGLTPALNYSTFSNSLFGDPQPMFNSESNSEQQTQKQTQSQNIIQKYKYQELTGEGIPKQLISAIYQKIKSQFMKQVILKVKKQQLQKFYPEESSNDDQALMAELEALKTNDPKQQNPTLNQVKGIMMMQHIYEELPLQTHNAAVKEKFLKEVKNGIMESLSEIVETTFEQQVTKQVKRTSEKVQNLVKLTHNYLKKHGNLPNVDHVNLEPIKIKFECEIPLQMKFIQGDFGQLVQKRQVAFQRLK